jgi:hypothetical protein
MVPENELQRLQGCRFPLLTGPARLDHPTTEIEWDTLVRNSSFLAFIDIGLGSSACWLDVNRILALVDSRLCSVSIGSEIVTMQMCTTSNFPAKIRSVILRSVNSQLVKQSRQPKGQAKSHFVCETMDFAKI